MKPFSALVIFLFLFSVSYAASPEGDGLVFDGKSGYEVKGFKPHGQKFSISAWVRVRNNADSQFIASLGGAPKDFTLYLYQGNVRMLVENAPMGSSGPGGAYDFASAPLPKPNVWTHYLGTYDGETIAVYVDGVKKGMKKAPVKRLDFSLPLFIGTGPEGGRQLTGSLDQVRLWNRALTTDEAGAVFKGEAIIDALIGDWNASGKQGDKLVNAVSGGPEAVKYVPKTAERRDARTVELLNEKDDGYRGIWYHNQPSKDEYVYKYSGGLGTYPANHYPFSVYAPEVDKTFFCYGGTDKGTEQTLLHEVSYFDHKTGTVPKPMVLLDKKTDDAHDNPVMNMDDKGHLWIFSTSHGTGRPSFIHRSKKPYDIEEFERIEPTKLQDGKEVALDNFSYMQIYHFPGQGFGAMFTTYDKRTLNDPTTKAARILCSMSSKDGVKWSEWRAFAGILHGHYQSTGTYKNEKIGSSFNMHPDDRANGRIGLNWRTNLYYMETKDLGETWRNVQGEKIEVPLTSVDNPALVYDYDKEKTNVYIMDVNFDAEGNPIILYLTSKGYESGPKNDPRRWHTAYWNGNEWKINPITDSDNNYDFGSLYVEDGGLWRIIGTTGSGPQAYNTGGEVAMWTSKDSGVTWTKERQMTSDSEFNHCYPRRPVNAHPDFYAFWATGHGRKKSPSTLYFCNIKGDVFELPRKMEGDTAKPKKINSGTAH